VYKRQRIALAYEHHPYSPYEGFTSRITSWSTEESARGIRASLPWIDFGF